MSYRIDEMTYWGGLSIPSKEREYPDAWDWVFKKMTRTLEESRKVCKGWCETANKLREKLEQMEKKKNKMTKAEAFEWLKCKKIKCCAGIANIYGDADEVEKRLFDVGCEYHFANHKSWREWYWPIYGFMVDVNGEMYVVFEDQMDFFKQSAYELITVEDLLSLDIVKFDDSLDEISRLGAQISKILRGMNCRNHVVITEDDVNFFGEGVNLYHSDPF